MQQTCLPDESAEHGRLRQRLTDMWNGMEQGVIGDDIDQWRKRLRACVRAKGVHFEYRIHCDLLICLICSWKIFFDNILR